MVKMSNNSARGQSALEYLVTYGWAILAIVIIAGALWYFGIFNPSKFSGEKQCGGFAAFICQDFKITSAGTLTIVLNNKIGGPINSVNMSGGGVVNCTPTSLAANQNTTCTFTSFVAAGTTGSQIDSTTVSLTYTDTRSSVAHTDSGFVRGKYE